MAEASRVLDLESLEPILDAKAEIIDLAAAGDDLRVLVSDNRILTVGIDNRVKSESRIEAGIATRVLANGGHCSVDQLVDPQGCSLDLDSAPTFCMERGQQVFCFGSWSIIRLHNQLASFPHVFKGHHKHYLFTDSQIFSLHSLNLC